MTSRRGSRPFDKLKAGSRPRGRAPSPTQPHRDRHNDGLAVAVISAMIAVFKVELGIMQMVQTVSNSSAIVEAAGILGI